MPTKPSPFVWYDIMTADMEKAAAFYSAVVGWRIADSGMEGLNYSILYAGDLMVGGMMPMPEGAPFPPMWTGYVYSADVDADAKRAVKLGGSVCKDPEDIPDVGRFAVIADPHGAMFNIFHPGSSGESPEVREGTPGHIGWRELHAGDLERDWAFYAEMFGWKKDEGFDMGPMGTYQTFNFGGVPIGGMMTKMKDTPQPIWNYYFNVDGIDAAAARIAKAGGKVLMGPHQVPGGEWIVQGMDPQGAAFALVSKVK